MAEERDEDQFGENQSSNASQQPTGQQNQANEFGQQQGQQSDQFGQQATGSQSGQPIGGNDSETGSGTTMSQGSDLGGQSKPRPRQVYR